MPRSISDLYQRSMNWHGRGYALYQAASTRSLRPGFCGYLDERDEWQSLLDLTDSELLISRGYTRVRHVGRRSQSQEVWEPMISSAVSGHTLKLDSSSALSAGLPADTSTAVKYTTSGDFGAVLMCANTVIVERVDFRDPFRVWLKENAAKLLSDYPALKGRGVYVVTTTYSCSDVYINAWNNPQDEITLGCKVSASGIGSIPPNLTWMTGNPQESWIHRVSDENVRNVIFFGGIKIEYRKLLLGAMTRPKLVPESEWKGAGSKIWVPKTEPSGAGDSVPAPDTESRGADNKFLVQDLSGNDEAFEAELEMLGHFKPEASTSRKSSNSSVYSDSSTLDENAMEVDSAPSGYIIDSSDESEEVHVDITAETFASTHSTESPDAGGHHFRLSEMNEDLLHPVRYKTKLRNLQASVFRESAAGQEVFRSRSRDSGPVSETNLLDWQSQQCVTIFSCIELNIANLQDAGFCESTATFIQIDPDRPEVALLKSVELDEVLQLRERMDGLRSPSDILELEKHCWDLLDFHFRYIVRSILDSVIVALSVLDLILVSHVYSHMGEFDYRKTDNTPTINFQISSGGTDIVGYPSLGDNSLYLSRRTLKCLNGFLSGEQVWVLHDPDINPMDPAELFLSTTPDAFANAWGPMWKITNADKPTEILRYDLEHGSIVPISSIPETGGRSVNISQDEQLCHWISNIELKDSERTSTNTSLPQIIHPRLLIGACIHSVILNRECRCNLRHAKGRFKSRGFLRVIGSSPNRLVTDAHAVGTAIGGGGVGAPTIQYSQTMKNTGRPAKESFLKRWKNSPSELRPWTCLLLRLGLQVSICTSNSRKVRLVDLLAGDTMKDYMRTYPSYETEQWRAEFEEMLESNPGNLVAFSIQQPSVEKYISACLDALTYTGIGKGEKQFVALWVFNRQVWEVAFPRSHYKWSRFEEETSFVVLEKCLINTFGRGCRRPQAGIPRIGQNLPAVLELFLTISLWAKRPDELRLFRRSDGKVYWNVELLEGCKHCIKLGKRGVLEGDNICSKRVLTGKWSSEDLIDVPGRKVSELLGNADYHTEHIDDDLEDEDSSQDEDDSEDELPPLPPLPYLVLDV